MGAVWFVFGTDMAKVSKVQVAVGWIIHLICELVYLNIVFLFARSCCRSGAK